MKHIRVFLTGAFVGAGLAAYYFQQQLRTKDARLCQLQSEKTAIQAALDAEKAIPRRVQMTPEEAAASMERAKRKVAWSMIPRWLTYDEDKRMSLILDTAKDGMSGMYPDAEMIAEYKRLEAEGKLNPKDFDPESLFEGIPPLHVDDLDKDRDDEDEEA